MKVCTLCVRDKQFLQNYESHHSWMFHTLKYNHEHNIEMSSFHDTTTAQRVGDRSIMEAAKDYYATSSELKSINKVRMMYNVIHVNDITNANDITLNSSFLKQKIKTPIKNEYIWPHKHYIMLKDMTVWRKFMR